MTTSELMRHPSASTSALPRQDEFDLVCLLASPNLSPGRLERIAGWDLSGVDWNEFLRLAEHHGVLPLVARNLIGSGSTAPDCLATRRLPTEVERPLRFAYEANLRRSLWFAAELARIMQHFRLRQLRVLPYKGPVLAQSLYGDVGLRGFSDLDFLIPPADFERAKRALDEIGYRPATNLTEGVERLWLRRGYERSFDGAAGKNLVELQWALLSYFYAVDLKVEDLLMRAGSAVVGGCEMACLSPEDSLLALFVHAGKHLWTRLIWLCDIAEALRLPNIDYLLLLSRAHKLGVVRIFGVSSWLVKNALHGEIPKPVEKMMADDPQIAVLGREFAGRLARGTHYDFESTEYFRLIMKLRERRGDRWRYFWRLVWTPGAGDVGAVGLPEALFPLYRIVRMGRLMRKLFF